MDLNVKLSEGNLAASSSARTPSSTHSASLDSFKSFEPEDNDPTPRPLSIGSKKETCERNEETITSLKPAIGPLEENPTSGHILVPRRRSSSNFSGRAMIARNTSSSSLLRSSPSIGGGAGNGDDENVLGASYGGRPGSRASMYSTASIRGSMFKTQDVEMLKKRMEGSSVVSAEEVNVLQKENDDPTRDRKFVGNPKGNAYRHHRSARISSLQTLSTFNTHNQLAQRAVTLGSYKSSDFSSFSQQQHREVDHDMDVIFTPGGPFQLRRARSNLDNAATSAETDSPQSQGQSELGESSQSQESTGPDSSRGQERGRAESRLSRGYVRWRSSGRINERKSFISRVFSKSEKTRSRDNPSNDGHSGPQSPAMDANEEEAIFEQLIEDVAESSRARGKTTGDSPATGAVEENALRNPFYCGADSVSESSKSSAHLSESSPIAHDIEDYTRSKISVGTVAESRKARSYTTEGSPVTHVIEKCARSKTSNDKGAESSKSRVHIIEDSPVSRAIKEYTRSEKAPSIKSATEFSKARDNLAEESPAINATDEQAIFGFRLENVAESSKARDQAQEDSPVPTSNENITIFEQQELNLPIEANAGVENQLSFHSDSIGTDSSDTSASMDTMLARFPNPPGLEAVEPAQAVRHAIFPRNTQPPVLVAKATITPDAANVDTRGGHRIWTAVEVFTDVRLPEGNDDEQFPMLNNLDIVMVIDTSIHTSQDCFNTAIDSTIFMCSLLDQDKDRVSIMFSSTPMSTPQILSPLQSLQNFQPASLLKSYRHPMFESSSHIMQSLKVARNIVQKAGNGLEDRASSPPRAKHIFVLSPNVAEWILPSNRTNEVIYHIVNPAMFPWLGLDTSGNGWELCSQAVGKPLGSKNEYKGIYNSLRRIVQHARFGTNLGKLTGVHVSFSPGKNCQIEEMVGEMYSPSLRPGQTMLLFVKLRIGEPSRPSVQRAGQPAESLLGEKTDGVMQDLEEMLGSAKSEILKVRLMHQHPLFAPSVIVASSFKGTVNRFTPQSEWAMSLEEPRIDDADDPANQFQQRLAYQVAANSEPREAMLALEEMFGSGYCLSVAPKYISSLTKELRFRTFVCAKHKIKWRPSRYLSLPVPTSDRQPEGESSPESANSAKSRRVRFDPPPNGPPNRPLPPLPNSFQPAVDARRIWADKRRMRMGSARNVT